MENEISKEREDEETLARAEAAAKKLEKENRKREEILAREEKLNEERKLSGSSDAGVPAEKPKEESDADYAKRLISKPYGDAKVETPE